MTRDFDLLSLPEDFIRERLASQNGHGMIPPAYLTWRRAAVLMPMLVVDGNWRLLFIRRTEQVSEHKGQVAFPGGAMEAEDSTLDDTALREANEEIGLQRSSARILGHLPDFFTITNYLIRPVVSVIDWPIDLRLSSEEVDRVFTIPLDWLSDPANREERPFIRPSGEVDDVVFFRRYDGEMLWGATARITLNFLDLLK